MIVRDIVYAPEHGERGKLDLHLPDGAVGCAAAGCPLCGRLGVFFWVFTCRWLEFGGDGFRSLLFFF